MKHITIRGIEHKEREIEVSERDLLQALENSIGTTALKYNEEVNAVGKWHDLSSDWSNFENWKFEIISRDEENIKIVQAMEILRKRVRR